MPNPAPTPTPGSGHPTRWLRATQRRALGRLLPLCLVLALLALGGGMARAADWPFGAPKGQFGMRGGDYFNLGLLGAKVRLADCGAKDVGPARLDVALLYPEGPAAAAGLRAGDVIIGVGRRPFREGSLGPLATALLKAQAGAHKGVLTLLLERDGERQKLAVPIPQGGKAAAKPLRGAGRLAILRAALDFLASVQQGDGGFKQTLSGANGAVVQTALAGLAWMTDGSDLEQGAYRKNVQQAVAFVERWCTRSGGVMGAERGTADPRMKGKGNWNQNNWGYAHAALFLGAVQKRTPTEAVKRVLDLAAGEIGKAQEASGGWAHGPGGPNGLGYVELNIVTGLSLMGLGMAHRAGTEVPAETLERADAYLKASSSGDGGIGYSSNAGQKGQGNIGRSAAAWLGYELLGKGSTGWCKKMRKYVARTVDQVQAGHASLMQHIFLAGLAADALGKKAQATYWATLERDLILARAPDGSFQPRPWHESLSMGTNSDVTFGQIWTTATWALVLGAVPIGADHPGLPELFP